MKKEKLSRVKKEKKKNDIFEELFKQKTVFVDIGADSTKIMEVEKKGKKISVKKAERVMNYQNKNDDSSNLDVATSVGIEMNEKNYNKKNVQIIYGNKKLQNKILMLRAGKEKEVKMSLEEEIEKNFSGLLEEGKHIIDHCTLGTVLNKEKTEEAVLVSLAEEGTLLELANVFENKEIRITDIHPNIVGLIEIGKMMDKGEPYKIILNLGYESSLIVFMLDDVAIYNRTINFGTQFLIAKIQSDFEKTKSEAKEMLFEIGLISKEDYEREEAEAIEEEYIEEFVEEEYEEEKVEEEKEYQDEYILSKDDRDEIEDEAAEIIKDTFENFVIELERSIAFVKQGNRFENGKIYLTGGLSNLRGVERYLEETIQLPTEKVVFTKTKTTEKYELELDEELGPEYAILIGMAMKGVI